MKNSEQKTSEKHHNFTVLFLSVTVNFHLVFQLGFLINSLNSITSSPWTTKIFSHTCKRSLIIFNIVKILIMHCYFNWKIVSKASFFYLHSKWQNLTQSTTNLLYMLAIYFCTLNATRCSIPNDADKKS